MAEERTSGTYLKYALLNQYNLVVLGAAAAFTMIDQGLTGVLLALGFELAWLSIVPGLAAFKRSVDRRLDEAVIAEARKKREALLEQLAPPHRQKFEQLESLAGKIRENIQRQGEAVRIVLEDSLAKADRLTASFVRLAIAHGAYFRYLHGTDRRALAAEIAALEGALEASPPRVREVKEQRLAIAKRRAERWDRARENIEVIQHQLATIEELLCLMHEQSIAPKDPQRMSDDLERFMKDLEGNEGSVRELAEFGAEEDAELAELELGRDADAAARPR